MVNIDEVVSTFNEEERMVWDKLDDTQKNTYKNFAPESWLSDPRHFLHIIMWVTFYRRNLDIFVEHYLKIDLYFYQKVIIYLLGISDFVVIIAARAASKSFIIGIFVVSMSILYPSSETVLTSGTKGQSKLIVSKKIDQELMGKNSHSLLHREIKHISTSGDEGLVTFYNSSTITTVTLGDSGLGNRSTLNVIEEAKTCNKNTIDQVISPFLHVRTPPFLNREPYVNMSKEDKKKYFIEEPRNVYISSSIEETHWLYRLATEVAQEMTKEERKTFLALDYSVCLEHQIRTEEQLKTQRKKIDPITWAVEYENQVFRANTNAYFSYEVIKQNRVLLKPFYPRKNEDVLANKKNPYAIPKQQSEIRVLSCDIASINRKNNDNSVFTCLRSFPERRGNNNRVEYRIQVPYLEARRGGELSKQAVRIRQLYEDFEADYLVLDLRNCGVALYYYFARPLYDPERCIEYAPLRCMNDDELAKSIQNEKADPTIYVVNGANKLNLEMAQNMQVYLTEKQIDLLVAKENAIVTIAKLCPSYSALSPEQQFWYDRPYNETMFLVNEMVELVYEKTRTGLKKIVEKSGKMKDRYSSISMGCYFVNLMSLDLISQQNQCTFKDAPSCVSTFTW